MQNRVMGPQNQLIFFIQLYIKWALNGSNLSYVFEDNTIELDKCDRNGIKRIMHVIFDINKR